MCTEEQESHSLRRVFYHKDIPRSSECPKLKVVPNTRKIHSIRNTGNEGILEKKDTSYCCPPYQHYTGPCEHPEYLDAWEMVSVTHHKKRDLKGIENTLHKRNKRIEKEMKMPKNNSKTPENDLKSLMLDTMKSPKNATKAVDLIPVVKTKDTMEVHEDVVCHTEWKCILESGTCYYI